MKRYKVGFLTSFDPLDKRKLSGVTYHLLRAIQKNLGDVVVLGPMATRRLLSGILNRIGKKFKKPYSLDHSLYLAARYAGYFKKKIKHGDYDLIIAPRSSTEIALLKTHVPVLYYSDTTFASLYNYYPWFSNFMKISEWEGHTIERMAQKHAKWVVFTSEWAARSAVDHYKTNPKKVHVIPFGPNLDLIPERTQVLERKNNDCCRLLFLGVEWARKGGDIAFDALLELKKKGIRVTITVVGCTPPDSVNDVDLKVIPFINKNNFDEYLQFETILLQSHFLILPTRAECFGVVFCEASAYALPSITTDTGGIPDAVHNGKNGYRLPLSAGGNAYANLIAEIFTAYDSRYVPLSISSRDLYESLLNWDTVTDSLRKVIES